jgi:hypothetical protein
MSISGCQMPRTSPSDPLLPLLAADSSIDDNDVVVHKPKVSSASDKHTATPSQLGVLSRFHVHHVKFKIGTSTSELGIL